MLTLRGLRSKGVQNLRVGDVVKVRSEAEILATLDSRGALDNMPFMPEMLRYCGQRFRVFKRADKTCDTIGKTGLRRLHNAVHLEGLRCGGDAHGGCQAACLLFWKEAWLEKVPKGVEPTPSNSSIEPSVAAEAGHRDSPAWATLMKTTRADYGAAPPGEEIYSCQATRLTEATSYLSQWDPLQYWRDVRSGNVGFFEFLRGILVLVFNSLQTRRGGRTLPFNLQGTQTKTPSVKLELQPGELVQVKSANEIMQTLDLSNKNRGLWFDAEMIDYCDKKFKVKRKIERIINDRTGKMIKLPNDCLILEGVVCRARYHLHFCPRGIYPYWREIWLKRVSSPPQSSAVSSPGH